MKKIAIITPSPDLVHADFAACLARLVAISTMNGFEVMFINPRFSTVGKARWDGVRKALDAGAEKILFIDSDQTFPAEGLIRLAATGKKIIGGISTTRVEPIEFTARINGKRYDMAKWKGLHRVGSNGFSFFLIDREVFSKVEEPWFGAGDKWYANEDEQFCHEAKRKGYTIWVDADLRIGHLGVKEYK